MTGRPIVLGLAGDSAAGKTTLAAGVAALLGTERVAIVSTDDYHRYSRAERAALGITALHPDANDLDVLETHVAELAAGRPVQKPVYDHRTGTFAPSTLLAPAEFLIVEGLLAFATPTLRQHGHMKVYMDPPEPLRRRWKIARDVADRAYSADEVLAELARREEDAEEFVRPQRDWADMVARFYEPVGGSASSPADSAALNVRLTMRPTLSPIDLASAIGANPGGGGVLRHATGREAGRLTDFLEIDGHVTAAQIAALAGVIRAPLSDLSDAEQSRVGVVVEGQVRRHSHPLGLTQVLIACHLLLARIEQEHRQRARPIIESM
jgi:phosphoribulokinase